MRVALVVTGKLEMLGMPGALRGAFGDEHEFAVIRRVRDEPSTPFAGFTSAKLPIADLADPDSSLSQLVGAMVDAICEERFDLVVVLDDVELYNQANERIVVGEFQAAVLRHLERLRLRDPRAADELRDLLRKRASFHLVAPMIESWIFADPAAPGLAGAPPPHLPPRLCSGRDPEDFETDDPAYIADTGAECSKWLTLQPLYRAKQRPEWLKPSHPHPRERHPKRYMAWLCRAPSERCCSSYSEATAAKALARLAWPDVLRSAGHMQFARSLISDLADGLATDPVDFAITGVDAPLTSIHTSRPKPVLRNV